MKVLLLCLFSIFLSFSVSAENVYRWVDAQGNTHYSSKPVDPKAEVANLPALTKEKVPAPPTLKQQEACTFHGGISCEKGPDTDGSVLCADGFTESKAPFRFSCSASKLEVADISPAGADGSFTVFVRNLTSVESKKPQVILRSVEGKEIPGTGPDTIEPLSIGEYKFQSTLRAGQKASALNFIVRCENCSG